MTNWQAPLSKSANIALFQLARFAKEMGALGMMYHVAAPFHSMTENLPRTTIFGVGRIDLSYWTEAHKKLVGLIHDFVLNQGTPKSYHDLFNTFHPMVSPEAQELFERLERRGIADVLLVPVYGPGSINACMGFHLPFQAQVTPAEAIMKLHRLSLYVHNLLVVSHGEAKKEQEISLSAREIEIINWLARGKSKFEISLILGISIASIDTYTRRMFRKLGVHDKLSAVLAGVARGVVRLGGLH